MRPKKTGGAQFLINGGRAKVGTWEEFRVDRGLAELSEGRFQIISLRTKAPLEESGGEATLRTAKPIRASGPATLELELTEYPFESLLGGTSTGLGRMFQGVVKTDKAKPGLITADPQLADSGELEVEFTGENGTLKDFLFLGGLSRILRNSDYETPVSGLISGTFKRDRSGMSLRDFQFDSKALLKVQGNIELSTEGQLGGKLRIGIPLKGLVVQCIIAKAYTAKPSRKPELGDTVGSRSTLSGTVERPSR